jgi:hypothetical protein
MQAGGNFFVRIHDKRERAWFANQHLEAAIMISMIGTAAIFRSHAIVSGLFWR